MTGLQELPVPSVADRVCAERVRVLYEGIKVAAISGPLGLAVLSALFWAAIDHRHIVVWAAIIVVIICPASLMLQTVYRRRNQLPSDANSWLRLMTWRYFILCSAFGSGGFVLFAPESITHQLILFCFLVALTSTQTFECAQDRWIYMTSLPVLLVPFIVRAAAENNSTSRLLAVLAAAALIYVLPTARNLSKMIDESLTNRFRNLELIEQLQVQKELAERSRDDANSARTFAEEASANAESARLEAVAANQAKSRFLAAASHDLRQPLHALGLFAAAARNHLATGQGQHILNKIESSIGSMEIMFDALLDISRLDAGVLKPNVKPFVLNDLLIRLASEYTPRAQAKGLRLRIRPCSHAVLSDPALLERVLRNYLANAIRYTQNGGILLACRARKNTVNIEVWDTGDGIASSNFKEIYQEFYQIGNAERNKANGLGLGLAIVKRISELLSHPISLSSRVQRGSKFAIEVLTAQTGTNTMDDYQSQPPNDAVLVGAVVLVIDDELNVLEAIDIVLKQWGCHVIMARSASEALAVLGPLGTTPDVILSDYRLRGQETGQDAIRAVQREFGQSPAALITGDTAPDRLHEAAESGYTLLHKPLNPRQLKAALLDLMGSRKAISQTLTKEIGA